MIDTNPDNPQPDGGASAPDHSAPFVDPDQLRAERDKFLDLAKRTQADFENYQKRNARDREEERRYALTPLARDLLPALDNLDRALGAIKDESALSKGVRIVRQQLLDTLRRHCITLIEAEGKSFDPNLHEAVMQQPDASKPSNIVLQVLENGYRYHDRVLRPSKVIVSK